MDDDRPGGPEASSRQPRRIAGIALALLVALLLGWWWQQRPAPPAAPPAQVEPAPTDPAVPPTATLPPLPPPFTLQDPPPPRETPADSAAADAAPAPAPAPAATLEEGLLAGNRIDTAAAGRAVIAHDALMAEFAAQMAADPGLAAVAATFTEDFARLLADADSGIVLERVACGRRVCVAEFHADDAAPLPDFFRRHREFRLPLFNAQAFSLSSPDGLTEHHFLFLHAPRP